MFIVKAYQTSQYVEPRGGIFLDKWRRSFAGNSDGKMNVQSAWALNSSVCSERKMKQCSKEKSISYKRKETIGEKETLFLSNSFRMRKIYHITEETQ
jgi:PBP1b-binding outer membrane lipoprotein LpoB